MDCLFIVPPFAPIEQPVLGISLLKSKLQQHGFTTKVLYLNLDYAEKISIDLYNFIGNNFVQSFIGEFIFTKALYDNYSTWQQYIDELFKKTTTNHANMVPQLTKHLNKLSNLFHHENPQIIKNWVKEILSHKPRIVAFSTTFQQNIVSLALAKTIRAITPKEKTTIIMGGANCEESMGKTLAKHFSFIDQIVSGESDNAIAEIVKNIIDQQNTNHSINNLPRFVQTLPVSNLNSLPFPNFDDFFNVIIKGKMPTKFSLSAETSRGCWWGERHQCKFCGLNGNSIHFRAKTPMRASFELRFLAAKYKLNHIVLTDCIMSKKHLTDVLPELKDADLHLLYETKANLTKNDLLIMKQAGVSMIQPGIESLSTPLLKLMRKGTTRLQNIQLLKHCLELNIKPFWNMLCDFPQENLADYADMIELLPHLAHLPPPHHIESMVLTRFSTYFNHANQEGIINIKPLWNYAHLYPELSSQELFNLSYYFDHSYPGKNNDYYPKLLKSTNIWKKKFAELAELKILKQNDQFWISDTRYQKNNNLYPLSKHELLILKEFDSFKPIETATQQLSIKNNLTKKETRQTVNKFLTKKWLISENEQALSLVVHQ